MSMPAVTATPLRHLRAVPAPISDPPPYRPGQPGRRHLRLLRPPTEQLSLELSTPTAHPPRSAASYEPDHFGRQHTPESGLPELEQFADAYCRAAAEILTGHRKLAQIEANCSPGVLRWLDDHRSVPDKAGRLPSAPRIRKVSVCRLRDGLAEVTALVQRGPRLRAMTARLIGLDHRWHCVHLGIV